MEEQYGATWCMSIKPKPRTVPIPHPPNQIIEAQLRVDCTVLEALFLFLGNLQGDPWKGAS